MPWTIGHKGDQPMIGAAVRGCELVEKSAYRFDHVEIRSLVATADVVGLANSAVFEHQRQRPCMVFDIEPIADILTVAVNRQWFAGEALDDHVRDQLFR